MNSLQLQQKLIEFTAAEGFTTLEYFKDEFQHLHLEGFDEFIKLKEDAYNSSTLFRTDKFEIRLLCRKPLQETPRHPHPENGCLMKIYKVNYLRNFF